jgi:Zn-dependent protease
LKCQFCGKEEPLPFACNYCGGTFCSEHRLPEAHQCTGDLSRRPVIITEPPSTFSWQSTSGASGQIRKAAIFSRIEVRDIVIAWSALGLAFYFAYRGYFSNVGVSTGLAISLATVGSGFVLHELSHKFVAERYGYWAEFRMWPMGILIALATSLIGFIFAAPGATYISGLSVSESQNGKISLAGPLTNVAVALIFLPFIYAAGPFALLGFIGFSVNMFLAVFNMLPIMPLDGAKVFTWSKLFWAAVFAPLALLNVFLLFGL